MAGKAKVRLNLTLQNLIMKSSIVNQKWCLSRIFKIEKTKVNKEK